MKFDSVKTVFAVVLALILGVVFYQIAPEEDSRKWVALAISFVSLLLALAPAMAVSFPAATHRGITIKTFSWAAFGLVLLTNLLFCLFSFNVLTYGIVVALEVVVALALVAAIARG